MKSKFLKQKRSVLVIEDNPDHWTIINTVFKRVLPQTNLIWKNAEKAVLDYLDECNTNYETLPCLILLDLYLPRREAGIRLLQKLKETSLDYARIPVVVLSNSNDTTDIRDMYHTGCASYLIKPADFESWQKLVEMIKTYWWDIAAKPSPND